MTWYYKGKEFNPKSLDKWFGFVYCITCPDGKKYIGRKYFWSFKKPKGKKRRKKVESDWRKYYGSHKELKEKVKRARDKASYHREILRLCASKAETNYYEIFYQFKLEVLHSDEYLNDNINGKWLKRNVIRYGPVEK